MCVGTKQSSTRKSGQVAAVIQGFAEIPASDECVLGVMRLRCPWLEQDQAAKVQRCRGILSRAWGTWALST